MTGANFYTYILSTLKRTDKSTEVYQAMTDVVMDMRLRFHAQDYKTISSALTISSLGGYSATLPTDFGHLIGGVSVKETVQDIEYPPLNKLSIQSFNEKYGSRFNAAYGNKLAGPPEDFCLFGGNLLIGPPVDRTTYEFRIAYTQESATEITSVTTSVPFTDKYRKCVKYGVLQLVYETLENYDEADKWAEKYERDLGKIIENDRQNSKDSEFIRYQGV